MIQEEKLLSVENLKTYFYTKAGVVKAVNGVSFTVKEGESLGLAGESACGKSITCLSIMRLIPQPPGRIVGGRILFEGENLVEKTNKEMMAWRGKKIGMILQDPLMSLNPVFTIGNQVKGAFKLDNKNLKGTILRKKIVNLLNSVKIPSAEERLGSYPFQFSGGMRQRTAAAIAIARSPKLLIADEPTTSLDVTIQFQFLKLLKEIQQETNMALILVTHDLAIVAECCDRIAVMYAGKIVESGRVSRIFKSPSHPYTQALMQALPRLGSRNKRLFQIEGEPPNPVDLPKGCSFHPRCPKATDICREEYPPVTVIDDEEYTTCWLLIK